MKIWRRGWHTVGGEWEGPAIADSCGGSLITSSDAIDQKMLSVLGNRAQPLEALFS